MHEQLQQQLSKGSLNTVKIIEEGEDTARNSGRQPVAG